MSLLPELSFAKDSTLLIAGNDGLYHLVLDETTGEISTPKRIQSYAAGSFLAKHPVHNVIYGCVTDKGKGHIREMHFDPKFTRVEKSSLTQFSYPAIAHLYVHPSGEFLAGALYGGERTTLISLRPDGSVDRLESAIKHEGTGPHHRQNQSRPHWVGYSKDGKFTHVTDLGADKVWSLELSESPDKLTWKESHSVSFPSGMGPRHLAFHPTLDRAYVTNELDSSVSVLSTNQSNSKFEWLTKTSSLTEKDVETFNNVSEIAVHPSGKFLYCGNRGNDSIAVFTIHPDTGMIKLIETEPMRGHWPRNFMVSNSGKWLIALGQRSDSVTTFSIDSESGKLQFTQSYQKVPGAKCVLNL